MSEAPGENWIRKAVESGLGIKFGSGVVGKTSHGMIVLIVVWGIVVWRIGDSVVANSFLMGGALVATALFVWWTKSTQNFAERNPAQALLDGAQFIEYKKFEAEVQGGSSVPAGPLIEDRGGLDRIGHSNA